MVANLLCGGGKMRGKKKKRPRLQSAWLLTTNTVATHSFYMRSTGAFLGPLLLAAHLLAFWRVATGCGDASVSNESLNAALYNWNHSIYGTALHKQNLFSRNQMHKLPGLYNPQFALNTIGNF
jgi:hypothetical protein